MITHIKHIKLIFMSPAYLSLKWVEFKKIFVHAPSRIRMLAIKQKNIIQSTIVCTYFCKLLFLLYLYSLFWNLIMIMKIGCLVLFSSRNNFMDCYYRARNYLLRVPGVTRLSIGSMEHGE